MPTPPLRTAGELASILRVHLNTIYAMTKTGRIPAIRAGRRYLYDLEQVFAALGAKEVQS
jgi:excisionase family DNA binding protein